MTNEPDARTVRIFGRGIRLAFWSMTLSLLHFAPEWVQPTLAAICGALSLMHIGVSILDDRKKTGTNHDLPPSR